MSYKVFLNYLYLYVLLYFLSICLVLTFIIILFDFRSKKHQINRRLGDQTPRVHDKIRVY